MINAGDMNKRMAEVNKNVFWEDRTTIFAEKYGGRLHAYVGNSEIMLSTFDQCLEANAT